MDFTAGGLNQVKCKALTAILSACNDNKFVAFCKMRFMAKMGLILVHTPQHVDAAVAETQAEQAQTCLHSQRSLGFVPSSDRAAGCSSCRTCMHAHAHMGEGKRMWICDQFIRSWYVGKQGSGSM